MFFIILNRNCAELHKGAWWYKDTKDLCQSSNLNGMNLGPVESDGTDIQWNKFGYNKAFDYYQSLKSVKMAIRPQ